MTDFYFPKKESMYPSVKKNCTIVLSTRTYFLMKNPVAPFLISLIPDVKVQILLYPRPITLLLQSSLQLPCTEPIAK